MHEADGADRELEHALARIRDRIASRTKEGIYPIGLDAELDGRFDRLAAMGRLDDIDAAIAAVERVRRAPRLAIDRIPTDSRAPGGVVLHKSVQRVVGRQLVGLIEQVEQLRADVCDALESLLRLMEPTALPSHTELASRLATLSDRVSRVDQVVTSIHDLERRVEELEAAHAGSVRMMQIHQVMVTAAPGDAVTRMALYTRGLLRRICSSEIYALHVHSDLADIRALADLPSAAPNRLLIYQSSIGDPVVTTLLERTDDPLMLVYHNITPSHFFTRWDHRVEHILEWGRHELELIRPRVVKALADSTFNASELYELGYKGVTVLPIGVEPGRLLPLPSPSRGLPRMEGTVILAVSQIMPHKRIDLLVETAYVLEHHLRANVSLLVVGASRLPVYDRALLELVRQLSVHRLHLLGGLSDQLLAELFRSAGIFVTVSEHEGLCVPPLEAMAFGVPVLARRYGAVGETLDGAALMLPPGSGPVTVAEGLMELVENRPLVHSLTRRGTELTERMAARATDVEYLNVIEDVLEEVV